MHQKWIWNYHKNTTQKTSTFLSENHTQKVHRDSRKLTPQTARLYGLSPHSSARARGSDSRGASYRARSETAGILVSEHALSESLEAGQNHACICPPSTPRQHPPSSSTYANSPHVRFPLLQSSITSFVQYSSAPNPLARAARYIGTSWYLRDQQDPYHESFPIPRELHVPFLLEAFYILMLVLPIFRTLPGLPSRLKQAWLSFNAVACPLAARRADFNLASPAST